MRSPAPTISNYEYDANGQRTRQTITHNGTTTTTLYIGQYAELRDDQLILYIFADDGRIAQLTTPFDADGLIQGFTDDAQRRGVPLRSPPPTTGQAQGIAPTPGMGGVFNAVNLNVYHYAGWNPINNFDPDGNQTKSNKNTPVDIVHNMSSGYKNSTNADQINAEVSKNYAEMAKNADLSSADVKELVKMDLESRRIGTETERNYSETWKNVTDMGKSFMKVFENISEGIKDLLSAVASRIEDKTPENITTPQCHCENNQNDKLGEPNE